MTFEGGFCNIFSEIPYSKVERGTGTRNAKRSFVNIERIYIFSEKSQLYFLFFSVSNHSFSSLDQFAYGCWENELFVTFLFFVTSCPRSAGRSNFSSRALSSISARTIPRLGH